MAHDALAGDGDLVRAVALGDEAAVEALLSRYWEPAYRVAFRFTRDPAGAEDVAQEAFVRLVQRADCFAAGRPFRPWFFRIVENTAKNALRGRERRGRHEERARPLAAGALEQGGDDAGLVREHLERLSEEQRAVIRLHYFHGLTHAEVAAELSCPLGTVASRLRRGLESLRRSLEPVLAGLTPPGLLRLLEPEETPCPRAPAALSVLGRAGGPPSAPPPPAARAVLVLAARRHAPLLLLAGLALAGVALVGGPSARGGRAPGEWAGGARASEAPRAGVAASSPGAGEREAPPAPSSTLPDPVDAPPTPVGALDAAVPAQPRWTAPVRVTGAAAGEELTPLAAISTGDAALVLCARWRPPDSLSRRLELWREVPGGWERLGEPLAGLAPSLHLVDLQGEVGLLTREAAGPPFGSPDVVFCRLSLRGELLTHAVVLAAGAARVGPQPVSVGAWGSAVIAHVLRPGDPPATRGDLLFMGSDDGGRTWEARASVPIGDARTNAALAWFQGSDHSFGRFVSGPDGRLVLVRSDDGGRTVVTHEVDLREAEAAIDDARLPLRAATVSSGHGLVYLAGPGASGVPRRGRVFFARSGNYGRTWSGGVPLTDPALFGRYDRLAWIAAGRLGIVSAFSARGARGSAAGRVSLSRSTDEGATWQELAPPFGDAFPRTARLLNAAGRVLFLGCVPGDGAPGTDRVLPAAPPDLPSGEDGPVAAAEFRVGSPRPAAPYRLVASELLAP